MATGKVQHWKHGWIPLDAATAQAAGKPFPGGHWSAPGPVGTSAAHTQVFVPDKAPSTKLLAHVMVARVAAKEPAVTDFLKGEAAAHGGRMEGLPFRIKTEKSLADKLRLKSEAKGLPPDKVASSITDVLRYTMIYPHDRYASGADETVKSLQRKGYTVKAENNWGTNPFYKGINADVTTPDGSTTFELQFHTDKSFATKMDEAQHKDYEIASNRSGHETAAARAAANKRMMARVAAVPVPPNASGVGTPRDVNAIASKFQKRNT